MALSFEAIAARGARRVLEAHGGLVEQLGEDAPGEGLDRLALALQNELPRRVIVLAAGPGTHSSRDPQDGPALSPP